MKKKHRLIDWYKESDRIFDQLWPYIASDKRLTMSPALIEKVKQLPEEIIRKIIGLEVPLEIFPLNLSQTENFETIEMHVPTEFDENQAVGSDQSGDIQKFKLMIDALNLSPYQTKILQHRVQALLAKQPQQGNMSQLLEGCLSAKGVVLEKMELLYAKYSTPSNLTLADGKLYYSYLSRLQAIVDVASVTSLTLEELAFIRGVLKINAEGSAKVSPSIDQARAKLLRTKATQYYLLDFSDRLAKEALACRFTGLEGTQEAVEDDTFKSGLLEELGMSCLLPPELVQKYKNLKTADSSLYRELLNQVYGKNYFGEVDLDFDLAEVTHWNDFLRLKEVIAKLREKQKRAGELRSILTSTAHQTSAYAISGASAPPLEMTNGSLNSNGLPPLTSEDDEVSFDEIFRTAQETFVPLERKEEKVESLASEVAHVDLTAAAVELDEIFTTAPEPLVPLERREEKVESLASEAAHVDLTAAAVELALIEADLKQNESYNDKVLEKYRRAKIVRRLIFFPHVQSLTHQKSILSLVLRDMKEEKKK